MVCIVSLLVCIAHHRTHIVMIFGSNLSHWDWDPVPICEVGNIPLVYDEKIILVIDEWEIIDSFSDQLRDCHNIYTFSLNGERVEYKTLGDFLPKSCITPDKVCQELEKSESEFVIEGLRFLDIDLAGHRSSEGTLILCLGVSRIHRDYSENGIIPLCVLSEEIKNLLREENPDSSHRGYYSRWAAQKLLSEGCKFLRKISPDWGEFLKNSKLEKDRYWRTF